METVKKTAAWGNIVKALNRLRVQVRMLTTVFCGTRLMARVIFSLELGDIVDVCPRQVAIIE